MDVGEPDVGGIARVVEGTVVPRPVVFRRPAGEFVAFAWAQAPRKASSNNPVAAPVRIDLAIESDRRTSGAKGSRAHVQDLTKLRGGSQRKPCSFLAKSRPRGLAAAGDPLLRQLHPGWRALHLHGPDLQPGRQDARRRVQLGIPHAGHQRRLLHRRQDALPDEDGRCLVRDLQERVRQHRRLGLRREDDAGRVPGPPERRHARRQRQDRLQPERRRHHAVGAHARQPGVRAAARSRHHVQRRARRRCRRHRHRGHRQPAGAGRCRARDGARHQSRLGGLRLLHALYAHRPGDPGQWPQSAQRRLDAGRRSGPRVLLGWSRDFFTISARYP